MDTAVHRLATLATIALLALSSSMASAKPTTQSLTKPIPFNCTNDARCGLRSDTAYNYQVVGSFLKTATRAQSDALFKKLRTDGLWLFLPNDPKQFYDEIAIVSVSVDKPGFKPITVMIPRFEADAGDFKVGDLVRYSPHLFGHEKPPVDTPLARQYWSLTGCVIILCRKEDKACFKDYHPAIYKFPEGKELNFNHAVVQDGITIDPNNMRPITPTQGR